MIGQQNADIADTLQLREVAMANFRLSIYMRCTLAPPGKYDWTFRVRRRCGDVRLLRSLVIVLVHRERSFK